MARLDMIIIVMFARVLAARNYCNVKISEALLCRSDLHGGSLPGNTDKPDVTTPWT
jgi:hypothetical protein